MFRAQKQPNASAIRNILADVDSRVAFSSQFPLSITSMFSCLAVLCVRAHFERTHQSAFDNNFLFTHIIELESSHAIQNKYEIHFSFGKKICNRVREKKANTHFLWFFDLFISPFFLSRSFFSFSHLFFFFLHSAHSQQFYQGYCYILSHRIESLLLFTCSGNFSLLLFREYEVKACYNIRLCDSANVVYFVADFDAEMTFHSIIFNKNSIWKWKYCR